MTRQTQKIKATVSVGGVLLPVYGFAFVFNGFVAVFVGFVALSG